MRRRTHRPQSSQVVLSRLATLGGQQTPPPTPPEPPAGGEPDGVWQTTGFGFDVEEQTAPSHEPAPEPLWPGSTPAAPSHLPPHVLPAGRHAHRRLGEGAEQPMPSRPPWVLSSAHLAVILAVVAVAAIGTTWFVLGGRATEQPAAPEETVTFAGGAVADAQGVEAVPDSGDAEEATATATVTVDVAGKVRRPGIAVLGLGARVIDAIEAAGGARRGVDLSGLNLARVLVDGEQVLVGGPAPPTPSGAVGSQTGALVNLNTADQVTLETLPGVGPVTAAAIMAWRTDNGPFTAVEELVEVDGIGEATLARLAPLVTI